eukprot:10801327-Prorocentrum_lima.AAC.1
MRAGLPQMQLLVKTGLLQSQWLFKTGLLQLQLIFKLPLYAPSPQHRDASERFSSTLEQLSDVLCP